MRVGYVTYGLDRSPTGIGRYAVELVRALPHVAPEIEIVLLTSEQTDQHDLWPQFEHYPLLGCGRLPMLMTWGNLMVEQAARLYKLDVIHDPNGIAPFCLPRGRARRIVTLHDACPFVDPTTHNWLDTWRYHRLLPYAVRQVDHVLTDSNHSADDLQNYLGLPRQAIRVAPCGIDQRFHPVAPSAARQAVLERYGLTEAFLLYVGGINARKNIPRLLEAFALVRERYPRLQLALAGKRQWQNAGLDATLARLDLGTAVRWIGHVIDADLPALYSAAEAFVFPSLYEGFGLPPLEALACGTPVVTSNASSLPEVMGDAALMVDPYAVHEISAAIEQVLSDQTLRLNLRARGLARAAHFSWHETARITAALYHELAP